MKTTTLFSQLGKRNRIRDIQYDITRWWHNMCMYLYCNWEYDNSSL